MAARRSSPPMLLMGVAVLALLCGAVYYWSGPVDSGASNTAPHATLRRVRKPIEAELAAHCASAECLPPPSCPRNERVKATGKTADGCCPTFACVPIGNAPEVFHVRFVTSKGDILVRMVRAWAPLGVDQVYKIVQSGFFKPTAGSKNRGAAMFRAVPKFVIQFGIHGDPKEAAYWRTQSVMDDPVVESNKRGYLTFAAAGKNTRTTQLFFNLQDNSFLDKSGFAPLGVIESGLDVLDRIEKRYGEKPNQGAIQSKGNAYLLEEFPELDFIGDAEVIEQV